MEMFSYPILYPKGLRRNTRETHDGTGNSYIPFRTMHSVGIYQVFMLLADGAGLLAGGPDYIPSLTLKIGFNVFSAILKFLTNFAHPNSMCDVQHGENKLMFLRS
ncbi:hypothetical protein [Methanococcoides sp. NM1]|uniref:hypothetical protein n=1 Tax=Methanococcoides sp. NM1 TaxID=1201013 RepID=UPI0014385ADE|nr:hypothetical protein [Methanococcoides sp. NM1]